MVNVHLLGCNLHGEKGNASGHRDRFYDSFDNHQFEDSNFLKLRRFISHLDNALPRHNHSLNSEYNDTLHIS